MYMNIYDGASIYVNLGHSEKPKKWDKFGKNESSTTCIIDIKLIIIVSYTLHIFYCVFIDRLHVSSREKKKKKNQSTNS